MRRKSISKTYRKLLVELDYKVPVADPMKCIARVANIANLSEKTKHQALHIMNEVAEKEISVGKDPMGLAATVLYVSSLKTELSTLIIPLITVKFVLKFRPKLVEIFLVAAYNISTFKKYLHLIVQKIMCQSLVVEILE